MNLTYLVLSVPRERRPLSVVGYWNRSVYHRQVFLDWTTTHARFPSAAVATKVAVAAAGEPMGVRLGLPFEECEWSAERIHRSCETMADLNLG